jgi:hypothetical protein
MVDSGPVVQEKAGMLLNEHIDESGDVVFR